MFFLCKLTQRQILQHFHSIYCITIQRWAYKLSHFSHVSRCSLDQSPRCVISRHLFVGRLERTLYSLRRVCQEASCKFSAYDASFLFGLAASDCFLLDVHQVTVHTRSARKRRHNPIRVSVFALLVSEGLPVQNLAVLQGNLAVAVGAHFVGQLGHGEESLKHLVNVGVLLRRGFKVGAVLVSADQLLDLVVLHLAVHVPVALVAADDERDVHVLFGFVAQAELCLVNLAFQALHLLERVSVIQAEHQDEHVA